MAEVQIHILELWLWLPRQIFRPLHRRGFFPSRVDSKTQSELSPSRLKAAVSWESNSHCPQFANLHRYHGSRYLVFVFQLVKRQLPLGSRKKRQKCYTVWSHMHHRMLGDRVGKDLCYLIHPPFPPDCSADAVVDSIKLFSHAEESIRVTEKHL